MNLKNRFEKVYLITLKKPYVFSFFTIAILYLGINIFVNKTYITAQSLFNNYSSFIYFFIFFTLLVAFLVAANINLAYTKIKTLRQLNKGSGLTALGAFGGILGGACPGCFVGLFPAFLGLFGVTASLGNLPFYGLEIQAISGVLLVMSLYLLTRDETCQIK